MTQGGQRSLAANRVGMQLSATGWMESLAPCTVCLTTAALRPPRHVFGDDIFEA